MIEKKGRTIERGESKDRIRRTKGERVERNMEDEKRRNRRGKR